MYTMDICIDDVMNELVKNHKVSIKKTVKKAYDYALEMHEGQTRKSGEPYIMHPLRVARFIATWGFESDVICAALLHDVVEDCHTTIDEVERLFGNSISSIVDAVTSLHNELENADELTLVINDEKNSLHGPERPYELSPLDVFFKIYENVLVNHNICILDHKTTTYGESNYFILRDEMDNLYRLFIKTETQYMRYKLGHVIDSDNYTFSSDFTNTDATMLDFAFMIHSELGFHINYATIDNNKGQRANAYDRLSPGDQITIETDADIQPKIQWFKYVKTERAIEHLIHKFSNTENQI